jgi:LmbE family N-acetylglucosaminyl deacetylase
LIDKFKANNLISYLLLYDIMSDQSILVVCAHPDDETLGAGGTIHRHTSNGIPVDVLCLTGNEERNSELQAACDILGVRKIYTNARDDFAIDRSLIEAIVNVVLESRPEIIITHSLTDYNRNHSLCADIVSEVAEWASHVTQFENAHRVKRIYNMEINSLHSKPNILMNITESYDVAVSALMKHTSQVSKAQGYYEKLYDTRTRLRGVQGACERAEAFTITLPQHAGPFYPKNSVDSLIP